MAIIGKKLVSNIFLRVRTNIKLLIQEKNRIEKLFTSLFSSEEMNQDLSNF